MASSHGIIAQAAACVIGCAAEVLPVGYAGAAATSYAELSIAAAPAA